MTLNSTFNFVSAAFACVQKGQWVFEKTMILFAAMAVAASWELIEIDFFRTPPKKFFLMPPCEKNANDPVIINTNSTICVETLIFMCERTDDRWRLQVRHHSAERGTWRCNCRTECDVRGISLSHLLLKFVPGQTPNKLCWKLNRDSYRRKRILRRKRNVSVHLTVLSIMTSSVWMTIKRWERCWLPWDIIYLVSQILWEDLKTIFIPMCIHYFRQG